MARLAIVLNAKDFVGEFVGENEEGIMVVPGREEEEKKLIRKIRAGKKIKDKNKIKKIMDSFYGKGWKNWGVYSPGVMLWLPGYNQIKAENILWKAGIGSF